MTPTPNQTMEGVRNLLRTSIAPELQSEQARFHLRKIMAVLRETDWEEAAFALMRENENLLGLIDVLAAWVAAYPRFGLAAPVSAKPDDPGLRGFALAQACNTAYRNALVGFVEHCANAGAVQPDGELVALRARTAEALARIAESVQPANTVA